MTRSNASRAPFPRISPLRLFAPALLTAFMLIACFPLAVDARTKMTMSQCDYFRNQVKSTTVEKSGTPRLLMLMRDTSAKAATFQTVYKTLERPELDAYADSPAGHFRVHYDLLGADAPDQTDTGLNGVPDYVDSTLAYLEYAWGLLAGMGYTAPIPDDGLGGNTAVDVYLQELSANGYYGYTSMDTSGDTGSSYLVLDNNYAETIYSSRGLKGLKVTTAHEFFHTIHFSYYSGANATWWGEHTAVWFEDYAWNSVNDYLNYLHLFLEDRDVSLDCYGDAMYGTSLFAFMLEKKYGTDILRSGWEKFATQRSGEVDLLDSVIPDGIATALSDLAVWCYFTGTRASTDFFRDASRMESMVTPEAVLNTFPVSDTLSCGRYCFKYVEIAPASGITTGTIFRFTFAPEDNVLWKKRLIFYNSPTDYEIETVDASEYTLTPSRSFEKVILAVSNTAPNTIFGWGNHALVYSITPMPYTLGPNYPNPFRIETTIPYTVPHTSRVSIMIYNALGQKIHTLVDETKDRGAFNVMFNISGLSLSSGVYFVVLESGETKLTRKMMLVK